MTTDSSMQSNLMDSDKFFQQLQRLNSDDLFYYLKGKLKQQKSYRCEQDFSIDQFEPFLKTLNKFKSFFENGSVISFCDNSFFLQLLIMNWIQAQEFTNIDFDYQRILRNIELRNALSNQYELINDEIYSIIKEAPIDLMSGPAKKILKNQILKKQVLQLKDILWRNSIELKNLEPLQNKIIYKLINVFSIKDTQYDCVFIHSLLREMHLSLGTDFIIEFLRYVKSLIKLKGVLVLDLSYKREKNHKIHKETNKDFIINLLTEKLDFILIESTKINSE